MRCECAAFGVAEGMVARGPEQAREVALREGLGAGRGAVGVPVCRDAGRDVAEEGVKVGLVSSVVVDDRHRIGGV